MMDDPAVVAAREARYDAELAFCRAPSRAARDAIRVAHLAELRAESRAAMVAEVRRLGTPQGMLRLVGLGVCALALWGLA